MIPGQDPAMQAKQNNERKFYKWVGWESRKKSDQPVANETKHF